MMLNVVSIRLAEIVDTVKSKGWNSVFRKGWTWLFREVVFFRRNAILVEKDLSEVAERLEPLASSTLKLLEIDPDMLSSGSYSFAVKHRYLKALHYLKRGYSGFAIARNNVVVGDMWYYSPEPSDDPSILPADLRWFGFRTLQKGEVYTFDIFVAPAERKHGVSAAFQNNAMASLRSKGYTKAYGYYFSDNLPAIWCTRVTNKWKELQAANISRFLTFTRVTPLPKDEGGRVVYDRLGWRTRS
jgi:GNAT superfamily N-acetyltransferase